MSTRKLLEAQLGAPTDNPEEWILFAREKFDQAIKDGNEKEARLAAEAAWQAACAVADVAAVVLGLGTPKGFSARRDALGELAEIAKTPASRAWTESFASMRNYLHGRFFHAAKLDRYVEASMGAVEDLVAEAMPVITKLRRKRR